MAGGGRDRLTGVLLLVENGLEIGNDDELAVPLHQALDEFWPPAHADAGRRLGVGAGQGGDLVNLVGAQTHQGRFAGQFDLDDDDYAVVKADPVPAGQEDLAEQSIAECPRAALIRKD